jgi:thioredoxin
MSSLVLFVLIGCGLGAALGYFGKCSSGACPLTATWRRGALFGALLGFILHALAARDGASASGSSQHVRLIGEAQFDAEVSQATGPVVVDFFATWCGPCKRLSPILESLAGPLTNRVKFVKIDVDQSTRLAQQFRIEGVPTLMFFEQGQAVDKLVGLPDLEVLKTKLEALASAEKAAEMPK